MKRILFFALAFASLISCQSLKEEFQPVFSLKYENPPVAKTQKLTPTHTIKELAALYSQGKPMVIKDDFIISGVVSTTDQPGNFYKSFYIQDATGGMEIKIGKNGLYNDYLQGQTIYVKCKDLSLGMYGYKDGNYGEMGMVQIGFEDPSAAYETSYMESPLLIDTHVIKGEMGSKLTPEKITSAQLPSNTSTLATNPYIGKLVTIENLRYGGKEKDVFVLLYIDSNKDKKASSNRIFVSDKQNAAKVTTWAMSKEKMTSYLNSGIWNSIKIGNANDQNYGTVGEYIEKNGKDSIEKNAYSVSQYFQVDGKTVEIRTSGYCKFADTEIDPAVLSGSKTITATGILTLYQGSIQLTVNDITDIKVNN